MSALDEEAVVNGCSAVTPIAKVMTPQISYRRKEGSKGGRERGGEGKGREGGMK